jgi:2,4-dienoyl-CoA reductase-like NADH-dependent reductase (Old Yellow Enzyme family)
MCMYSSQHGHLTDFHLVHLSAFASRGASLTLIEATAVRPEGRITPEDSGLWDDAQIAGVRKVADFIHSQNQKIGIQLAHAGRKAGTVAPWLVPRRGGSVLATQEVGWWPGGVVGPSVVRWGEGYADPKEMSVEDIRVVVEGFRDAARRAVAAGVDVIEIHAAHGYLLCSFLSPLSNRRTDAYGGSFENRIRMLVETIRTVRKVIPADMPLLLRVSATEWMDGHPDGSWDVPQTIRFAKMLPALGVDLLDVSSGGNHRDRKIVMFNDFQVGIAGQIRAALKEEGIQLLVGAVGMITDAEVAKSIVEVGKVVKLRHAMGEMMAR